MKNISRILALSSLWLMLLCACKKDEHKDFFLGGKPLILTPLTNTSGSGIDLTYLDADKVAVTLSWTNPDYRFTTGVSSQDVNYQLQIDTTGAHFKNPQKKVISISRNLQYSISEGELNDYMLNQLGLQDSMPHQLEMRIISSIGTSAAVPLVSNTVKFSATPYAIPPKVMPPPTGTLFITGDATKGNWMVGGDPASVPDDQQFTRVTATEYTITVDLIGGKQYLFVLAKGDWSHKYACRNTTAQSPAGGDFGYDQSSNFPAPAESGTYKIEVDFQRGKYTVTKQ